MLIENFDYFGRYIPFPSYAADGAVLPNDDGTFSVYINSNLDDDRKRIALRHELEHIEKDHFESTCPIMQIEQEADSR